MINRKHLINLFAGSLLFLTPLISETVCVDGICTTNENGVYRTQDSLQAADCNGWDCAVPPHSGLFFFGGPSYDDYPHRDESEEWMLEEPDWPGRHDDQWIDDLSR